MLKKKHHGIMFQKVLKIHLKDFGIPYAEKKYLAGVSAQFDSEEVYHNVKEILTSQGVIYMDMSEAVKKYPELVKKYFLVVAATDDMELNDRISHVCMSENILVNNVSSKTEMNAMFGGIVKNSEFQIAISTSGKNCKRSRAMKSEIQKILDKIEK